MIASDSKIATTRNEESLSNVELLAAYEQGIDELRAAVAGMTAEQIQSRPIAGKWSTLEVVCHLAGTEIYFTDRIERTLAAERPLLIGVDESPYAGRLKYQALDIGEELDLFVALRRHAARVLRSQPSESWERTGVHSYDGLVTLRQLVVKAIRHLRHHLPFIAEKRAAMGKRNAPELESEPRT